MDGAVQAGKDGKPHSVTAAAGTSTALTISHDKTKASESQAAQRAREVRSPFALAVTWLRYASSVVLVVSVCVLSQYAHRTVRAGTGSITSDR